MSKSTVQILCNIPAGKTVYVNTVNDVKNFGMRLLELGFTPDTLLRVLRNDGQKAPLEIELRGTLLTLGFAQAAQVQVKIAEVPQVSFQQTLPQPFFAKRKGYLPESKLPIRIALVGNPNSGKSTLFAALTGVRVPTGNYPGVTVEEHCASLQLSKQTDCIVHDLPGCYSLVPLSLEESIAARSLTGTSTPHIIVCVLDTTQLARSLYLLMQLRQLPQPIVVVFNMIDMIVTRKLQLDLPLLVKRLGLPWVAMSARREEGIADLLQVLNDCISQQLLKKPETFLSSLPLLNTTEDIIRDYRQIDALLAGVVSTSMRAASATTYKIDRILLHPFWGRTGIILALFGLLQLVFWAAAPMVWLIENLLSSIANFLVVRLPVGDILQSLLIRGLMTGVGNVLTFVPQICFLFIGIAVLEESGMMARIVFMLDHFMQRWGLGGRSLIPLLSSCGCAVPGIMATRMIASRTERLATIFVAPFMSCSARLPTYWVVTSALFSAMPPVLGVFSVAGIVIFIMYLLGLVAALLTSWVLRRTVLKPEPQVLCFELPEYRFPQSYSVLLRAWERCLDFVRDTGFTMVTLSLIVWALLSFPQPAEKSTLKNTILPVEQSYAGQLGHAIEPILKPLGFDWRIGIGLVASFAAREVLVTTLTQVYSFECNNHPVPSLHQALLLDIDPATQQPRFTFLVGLSLLVFFALALQCVSTVAVVRRETHGWGWPTAQLAVMNGLAYGVSLLVYQGGRLFGWR